MIKTISWNCKGLGNSRKLYLIRSLVKSEKKPIFYYSRKQKRILMSFKTWITSGKIAKVWQSASVVPQEDSIQSRILNFSVRKAKGLPSLAHDSLASSPIWYVFLPFPMFICLVRLKRNSYVGTL